MADAGRADSMNFEFDFGGESREALMAEVRENVIGLARELSQQRTMRSIGEPRRSMDLVDPAQRLLEELNQQRAFFSRQLDFLKLEEAHFAEQNLPVPDLFKRLSERFNFYWLHLPVGYYARPNMPFVRVECAVEFNPNATDAQRPVSALILPNKKFLSLLQAQAEATVRLGSNFEFEAQTGEMRLPSVGGSAALSTGAGISSSLSVGPFSYRLVRAQIEHSGEKTHKVFWRISGADFFRERVPQFAVVLQVPRSVNQLQVAAALQAYAEFNFAAAGLGEIIGYLGQRLANFLRAGAPVRDTQLYDLSAQL
ncbi:MAG: hypothetical protein CUN49_05075 [Candidatus Thermofonsia Clade 1 bacterium]|uniref:Uncharacterized protein n=1 Tax=Candidatus Thermofonsia Clade 1 bacterium TaxID=2364210 RepID=A0A2M8PG39_9CHLR|nr:MAG: hypothetical protein CUN49_05075 [Candidatus Thermofonsia Clade 1 bacterium]